MKKQPAFGLDIGLTTMKAVWLSPGNGGFILSAAHILPVPSKGMLSESPIDQEAMAQAVKRIVQEAKIGTPFVNISLPENQVYTKVIEMPVLSEKELETAIYYEAEQYIPVPLQTVSMDWKILRKPDKENEGQMEVLLVGAPTVLLEKYLKILEAAGLTVSSVETEILSTVRALAVPQKEGPFPPSVIINIGAVSTSLAIIESSSIVFTYSIPTGGTAINRAISSDFGLTPQQAEEYKKVYGVSGKTLGGKIGKATEPILATILSELKKAISLYNQKYRSKPEASLKQIILSGGTAKLPGIELFFAQSSGIETVIANPWKILQSQTVPKEIIENASDYTIAAGLAMRDYE